MLDNPEAQPESINVTQPDSGTSSPHDPRAERRLRREHAMLKAEHDRLMVEQERLKAESERLLAERAGVLAEFRASGQSLVMTDDQYERMLGLAMAAGPEAMEWFRETARLAGRA